MSDTLTLEPVAGRRVRDPATGLVVEDTITVARSTFWDRRIEDGDVSIVAASPAKKEKAA